MRIAAIVSSPETGGNTEAVVNRIAESARENGNEVNVFRLAPMTDKKDCKACMKCKSQGRCVQEDDLAPVLEAIRESDGVILSTPVYFGAATGEYRMLEDRFFSFLDARFKLNIPEGKKVAVVVAAGSAGAEQLADRIEGVMTSFFKCQSVGKIAFRTGNFRCFASQNDRIMEAADAVGKAF